MELTLLQELALAAGILGVAATVISFMFAVWTYHRNTEIRIRTEKALLRLLALGTLQHYLNLAVQHPDLATREKDKPVDPRYGWFAAQALFTAQTLRTLVGHETDWQRSINAIIRQHRNYLQSGAFVCEDFAPDFVSYLRERIPDLKCVDKIS